jgi:hypothetical protein
MTDLNLNRLPQKMDLKVGHNTYPNSQDRPRIGLGDTEGEYHEFEEKKEP